MRSTQLPCRFFLDGKQITQSVTEKNCRDAHDLLNQLSNRSADSELLKKAVAAVKLAQETSELASKARLEAMQKAIEKAELAKRLSYLERKVRVEARQAELASKVPNPSKDELKNTIGLCLRRKIAREAARQAELASKVLMPPKEAMQKAIGLSDLADKEAAEANLAVAAANNDGEIKEAQEKLLSMLSDDVSKEIKRNPALILEILQAIASSPDDFMSKLLRLNDWFGLQNKHAIPSKDNTFVNIDTIRRLQQNIDYLVRHAPELRLSHLEQFFGVFGLLQDQVDHTLMLSAVATEDLPNYTRKMFKEVTIYEYFHGPGGDKLGIRVTEEIYISARECFGKIFGDQAIKGLLTEAANVVDDADAVAREATVALARARIEAEALKAAQSLEEANTIINPIMPMPPRNALPNSYAIERRAPKKNAIWELKIRLQAMAEAAVAEKAAITAKQRIKPKVSDANANKFITEAKAVLVSFCPDESSVAGDSSGEDSSMAGDSSGEDSSMAEDSSGEDSSMAGYSSGDCNLTEEDLSCSTFLVEDGSSIIIAGECYNDISPENIMQILIVLANYEDGDSCASSSAEDYIVEAAGGALAPPRQDIAPVASNFDIAVVGKDGSRCDIKSIKFVEGSWDLDVVTTDGLKRLALNPSVDTAGVDDSVDRASRDGVRKELDRNPGFILKMLDIIAQPRTKPEDSYFFETKWLDVSKAVFENVDVCLAKRAAELEQWSKAAKSTRAAEELKRCSKDGNLSSDGNSSSERCSSDDDSSSEGSSSDDDLSREDGSSDDDSSSEGSSSDDDLSREDGSSSDASLSDDDSSREGSSSSNSSSDDSSSDDEVAPPPGNRM